MLRKVKIFGSPEVARTLPVSTCSMCRRPVAMWINSTLCHGCCTTQRDPKTMPTCSTGCWVAVCPVVNINRTLENHNCFNGKLTVSMAIFNRQVKIARGHPMPCGIWGAFASISGPRAKSKDALEAYQVPASAARRRRICSLMEEVTGLWMAGALVHGFDHIVVVSLKGAESQITNMGRLRKVSWEYEGRLCVRRVP